MECLPALQPEEVYKFFTRLIYKCAVVLCAYSIVSSYVRSKFPEDYKWALKQFEAVVSYHHFHVKITRYSSLVGFDTESPSPCGIIFVFLLSKENTAGCGITYGITEMFPHSEQAKRGQWSLVSRRRLQLKANIISMLGTEFFPSTRVLELLQTAMNERCSRPGVTVAQLQVPPQSGCAGSSSFQPRRPTKRCTKNRPK